MKRYSWNIVKIPTIILGVVFLLVGMFTLNEFIVGRDAGDKVKNQMDDYINNVILTGNDKYRIEKVEYDKEDEAFIVTEIYNHRIMAEHLRFTEPEEFIEILEGFIYSDNTEDNNPFNILEGEPGNCQAISLFINDWFEINHPDVTSEIIEMNTPFHLYNKLVLSGGEVYVVDLSRDKKEGLDKIREIISKL